MGSLQRGPICRLRPREARFSGLARCEPIWRGSDAPVTLWKRSGVKVTPGAFLAQTGRDGTNPGANFVRDLVSESRDDPGSA
jgi:hypothetical protein